MGKHMLSIGMKAIKIILTFVILLQMMGCTSNEYHEPKIYQDRINTIIQTSNDFCISDVFDFEFDYAYLAGRRKEIYADEEYFLRELHVNTNVKIPTLESGGHSRILFIKDNTVIYDFVYEMHLLPDFNGEN